MKNILILLLSVNCLQLFSNNKYLDSLFLKASTEKCGCNPSGLQTTYELPPFAENERSERSVEQLDSTICYKWDTLTSTWLPTNKTVNEWDANGMQTLRLYQYWNGTSWENNQQYIYTWGHTLIQYWYGAAWHDSIQHTFTYDASNRLTDWLQQTWNGTTWVFTSQSSHTYNANGYETSFHSQIWGSDEVFYTYDGSSNRRQLIGIRKTWNNTSSTWVNYSKDSSTYDGNGHLIYHLYQTWDGNTWVNNNQTTYTYDANGNLTNTLYETWNGFIWVNGYAYTYTYDANGNRISSLKLTPSVYDEIITSTYDANGKLTNEVQETGYTNGGVWHRVSGSQSVYTYDANGKLLNKLQQSWNGSVWVNFDQYTYTYDANGNRTSTLYQRWVGGAWINNTNQADTYDANGKNLTHLEQNFDYFTGTLNDWRLTTTTYDASGYTLTTVFQTEYLSNGYKRYDSCHYYYSAGVSGILNTVGTSVIEISLFPNPAINQLFIETTAPVNEVNIYNTTGALVSQTKQPLNNYIDISQLADGVYIAEIKTKETSARRRWVKM